MKCDCWPTCPNDAMAPGAKYCVGCNEKYYEATADKPIWGLDKMVFKLAADSTQYSQSLADAAQRSEEAAQVLMKDAESKLGRQCKAAGCDSLRTAGSDYCETHGGWISDPILGKVIAAAEPKGVFRNSAGEPFSPQPNIPMLVAGPDFSRFTDRARKCVQLARQEAQRFNHAAVEGPHLLLGLIKEGSGVAANALKNLGVDLRKIRTATEAILPCAVGETGPAYDFNPTMDSLVPVFAAAHKAIHDKHNYVGTEHLLLGLMDSSWMNIAVNHNGTAMARVFHQLGLTYDGVRDEVNNLLGYDTPSPEEKAARRGGLPAHGAKWMGVDVAEGPEEIVHTYWSMGPDGSMRMEHMTRRELGEKLGVPEHAEGGWKRRADGSILIERMTLEEVKRQFPGDAQPPETKSSTAAMYDHGTEEVRSARKIVCASIENGCTDSSLYRSAEQFLLGVFEEKKL